MGHGLHDSEVKPTHTETRDLRQVLNEIKQKEAQAQDDEYKLQTLKNQQIKINVSDAKVFDYEKQMDKEPSKMEEKQPQKVEEETQLKPNNSSNMCSKAAMYESSF